MKYTNRYLQLVLLIVAIACFSLKSFDANAGTLAKKERVRMKMYYYKLATGDRMVSIALTAGTGKKMHGVREGEVLLTAVLNDSTLNLATFKTDTLGQVSLYFASDYVFPMNEEGKTILEAEYMGNDVYRSASNDLEIMDLDLNISFNIEDSVKYLSISATTLDAEGNKIPVEELDINIGVQRLFSVLPIDNIETDEDGVAELEFPDDIPGDDEGNITIVAKVDESDDFGTVERVAAQKWGTEVSYEIHPLPRQLFSDEAPLWMIASVFIFLLGAWYHFFLSISKLIKLKKAGKAS
jgi:hypothetical protein